MAAEDLGPLFGERVSKPRLKVNSSRSSDGVVVCQKWIAAAYGGAVVFRSFTGPLVLSSGCWVHDGFQLFWSVRRPDANDRQPLTAATARVWCCTIWNVE